MWLKKQLCSSGCSIFNYGKKKPKTIKFRNSVQAPFHTGKKKNHSSTWFLSRWSNFPDHPHCLLENLCWLCHLLCEPCIFKSNLFFSFADLKHCIFDCLCADVCRGSGISLPEWEGRTPQAKKTAQKFRAQHPFYLKELSAPISWNAIPWAGIWPFWAFLSRSGSGCPRWVHHSWMLLLPATSEGNQECVSVLALDPKWTICLSCLPRSWTVQKFNCVTRAHGSFTYNKIIKN